MWSFVREIARCRVVEGSRGHLVSRIVVVILQRSVRDPAVYRYREAGFPSFGPAGSEEEAVRWGREYAKGLGGAMIARVSADK